MTNEKLEGTIVLEGLLQGRCPSDTDFETHLREWTDLMRRMGLNFSPEINAGQFSLLPDGEAASTAELGDAPEHTVQQGIEQLFKAFPEGQPGQLFSTLRSREYRKGEEVQTQYAVSGNAIKTHTRSVVANTVAPPQPIPLNEKLKIAGIGIGISVVLLGLLLLIPGVRQMFGDVIDSVKSFDAEGFTVQPGPYADYYKVTLDKEKSGNRGAVLQLARQENFPLTEADLTAAAKQAEGSLMKRLTVEAIARGRLRVELFDAAGKYLGMVEFRVAEHYDAKKGCVELTVPFPQGNRVARIVFAL